MRFQILVVTAVLALAACRSADNVQILQRRTSNETVTNGTVIQSGGSSSDVVTGSLRVSQRDAVWSAAGSGTLRLRRAAGSSISSRPGWTEMTFHGPIRIHLSGAGVRLEIPSGASGLVTVTHDEGAHKVTTY